MSILEWRRGQFTLSTDQRRLDIAMIHRFLTNDSYWAGQRTLDQVERSIGNSLTFGMFDGDQQMGFARVITDYTTFAWLADVFILPDWRGQGCSKWLITVVMSHPDLQSVSRWMLATRDAHSLYRQFGFQEVEARRLMECLGSEPKKASEYRSRP